VGQFITLYGVLRWAAVPYYHSLPLWALPDCSSFYASADGTDFYEISCSTAGFPAGNLGPSFMTLSE